MILIKKIFIILLLAIFTAFIMSGTATATEKISKNKNGINSNSGSISTAQSISSDGRYVTFISAATDIVSNDINGANTDVFLRDTVTKKTQRVNYKKDGTQPTGNCNSPVISANGRYVAYCSDGDLGFNTLAGIQQVYVYDRVVQSTELVSQSTTKLAGNGDSEYPSISADGRYITFNSIATNLWDAKYETHTLSDNNGASDVFLRDRVNVETKRISLSTAGTNANGASKNPQISANGRYIVYYSMATNLVDGTDNLGHADIFVYSIWGDITKKIMGLANAQPNGYSIGPSISASGQYVAFLSSASNLVSNDNNGLDDIFVADIFTPGNPNVKLISVSSSQTQGNGNSWYPSISADGRFITFVSAASNLVSGDTLGYWDIFVRDRVAGLTKRISVSSTGAQANHNSYNFIGGSAISGNGKYVVFNSWATNLVSGDNNQQDVFINTVDFTGPVVKSTNPKNGAKKVKRISNIYLYFNENIRLQNAAKIILKNSKRKVIASLKTVSGNKLTINPKIKLAKNTIYYITLLPQAVSDFANNFNYNKKYVFRFNTGQR